MPRNGFAPQSGIVRDSNNRIKRQPNQLPIPINPQAVRDIETWSGQFCKRVIARTSDRSINPEIYGLMDTSGVLEDLFIPPVLDYSDAISIYEASCDAEVPQQTITMKDAVSFRLIQLPVRSIRCTHLQCFDYYVYLTVNKQLNRHTSEYRCPICNQIRYPDTLYIDPIMMQFRKRLHEMTEGTVHIHENGLFSYLSTQELADSENIQTNKKNARKRSFGDDIPPGYKSLQELVPRTDTLLKLPIHSDFVSNKLKKNRKDDDDMVQEENGGDFNYDYEENDDDDSDDDDDDEKTSSSEQSLVKKKKKKKKNAQQLVTGLVTEKIETNTVNFTSDYNTVNLHDLGRVCLQDILAFINTSEESIFQTIWGLALVKCQQILAERPYYCDSYQSFRHALQTIPGIGPSRAALLIELVHRYLFSLHVEQFKYHYICPSVTADFLKNQRLRINKKNELGSKASESEEGQAQEMEVINDDDDEEEDEETTSKQVSEAILSTTSKSSQKRKKSASQALEESEILPDDLSQVDEKGNKNSKVSAKMTSSNQAGKSKAKSSVNSKSTDVKSAKIGKNSTAVEADTATSPAVVVKSEGGSGFGKKLIDTPFVDLSANSDDEEFANNTNSSNNTSGSSPSTSNPADSPRVIDLDVMEEDSSSSIPVQVAASRSVETRREVEPGTVDLVVEDIERIDGNAKHRLRPDIERKPGVGKGGNNSHRDSFYTIGRGENTAPRRRRNKGDKEAASDLSHFALIGSKNVGPRMVQSFLDLGGIYTNVHYLYKLKRPERGDAIRPAAPVTTSRTQSMDICYEDEERIFGPRNGGNDSNSGLEHGKKRKVLKVKDGSDYFASYDDEDWLSLFHEHDTAHNNQNGHGGTNSAKTTKEVRYSLTATSFAWVFPNTSKAAFNEMYGHFKENKHVLCTHRADYMFDCDNGDNKGLAAALAAVSSRGRQRAGISTDIRAKPVSVASAEKSSGKAQNVEQSLENIAAYKTATDTKAAMSKHNTPANVMDPFNTGYHPRPNHHDNAKASTETPPITDKPKKKKKKMKFAIMVVRNNKATDAADELNAKKFIAEDEQEAARDGGGDDSNDRIHREKRGNDSEEEESHSERSNSTIRSSSKVAAAVTTERQVPLGPRRTVTAKKVPPPPPPGPSATSEKQQVYLESMAGQRAPIGGVSSKYANRKANFDQRRQQQGEQEAGKGNVANLIVDAFVGDS